MRKVYLFLILSFSLLKGNEIQAQSSLESLTDLQEAVAQLAQIAVTNTSVTSVDLTLNGTEGVSHEVSVISSDGTSSKVLVTDDPNDIDHVSIQYVLEGVTQTGVISRIYGEFKLVVVPWTGTLIFVYNCDVSAEFDQTQGQYYWEDNDEDGYILESDPIFGCTKPPGFISEEEILGIDCDDSTNTITTECCPPIESITYNNPEIQLIGEQASWTIEGCNVGYLGLVTGLPYYSDFNPKTISISDFEELVGTTGGLDGCLDYAAYKDEIIPNSEGFIEVQRTFYLRNRYLGRGVPSTLLTLVILIKDTSGPTPALETLPDLKAQCSLILSGNPPRAFDCGNQIDGVLTSSQTSFFEQGTYTLTWTYTDGGGNKTTQEQKVIIDDTTPPVPDSQSLPDLVGECGVQVADTPTATDSCVGTIRGETTDYLYYTEQGEHWITWVFDDGNGNKTFQNQKVIIKDMTAPVPDMETLPDLVGECSVEITTKPTATDNCEGRIVGYADSIIFSEQGEFSVTWFFDDGNGNVSTQYQKVIIKDVTPPVLSLKAIEVRLDDTGNANISIDDIDNGTEDNCSSFEDLVFEISQTEFNCSDLDEVTIEVKATDLEGNTSEPTSVVITILEPLNPLYTEIESTVLENANDNVVIFSNAPASLGLPSQTTLTAGSIPGTYTGLSFEWYIDLNESGIFELIDGETNPMLEVISSGDFVAIYKVVVTSDSGCVTEDQIKVVSVEASCDKGGEDKVQVCHVIGGDWNKRKTICVNANAVDALLANSPGSFLGSCSVTYRLEKEPELVVVPWNSSIQEIERKINEQAANWFAQKKLKFTISSAGFDPIKSGVYQFEVNLEGSEEFSLEESIKVPVQVSQKPAPIAIEASNSSIPYQPKAGELLATFRTIDPVDDIHTYSIGSDPNLTIQGDKLIWMGSGTAPAQMEIAISSTDRAGQTISKSITLYREILPNDFLIYPNPARSETTVVVQLEGSATVSILLFDASGKLVLTETAVHEETFEQKINLDGLAPGIFYVQVKVGIFVMTKRLVKM